MIPSDTPQPRRCFGLREVARQLGISYETMKRVVRSGQIASIKLGDRRLIPAEALDEYIERLKAESAA